MWRLCFDRLNLTSQVPGESPIQCTRRNGLNWLTSQNMEAGSSASLEPNLIFLPHNVGTNGRYKRRTETWYGLKNYGGGASPFG